MSYQSCEQCKFWWYVADYGQGERWGECRRRAPRPILHNQLPSSARENGVGDKDFYAFFPVIESSEWCGEFEQKAGDS